MRPTAIALALALPALGGCLVPAPGELPELPGVEEEEESRPTDTGRPDDPTRPEECGGAIPGWEPAAGDRHELAWDVATAPPPSLATLALVTGDGAFDDTEADVWVSLYSATQDLWSLWIEVPDGVPSNAVVAVPVQLPPGFEAPRFAQTYVGGDAVRADLELQSVDGVVVRFDDGGASVKDAFLTHESLPTSPSDTIGLGEAHASCGSCTGRCQQVSILGSQAGSEVEVDPGQTPSQCIDQIQDACKNINQHLLKATCGN